MEDNPNTVIMGDNPNTVIKGDNPNTVIMGVNPQYLDVDLYVEGLSLAVAVADVEAEGVLPGVALCLLDVEDEVRGQVLQGEGLVSSDDPGACCASWWREEDITCVIYRILYFKSHIILYYYYYYMTREGHEYVPNKYTYKYNLYIHSSSKTYIWVLPDAAHYPFRVMVHP